MPPLATGGVRAAPASNIESLRGFFRLHAPLLMVLVIALLVRAMFPTTADVSWLITVGEKVLDGAQPYRDILEVNPPASILIYLPAVALARLLHLSPEFVVGALVFVGTGIALLIAGAITRQAKLFSEDAASRLAALFAAVLLILPAQAFAQREHVALIAFMPALAVYAARSAGKSPALIFTLIAGVGAGITVVIKPHLVFGIVFASAAAAGSSRDWRVLFATENWVAAAMAIAYAALVWLAYPVFISDVLPLVSAIYLPVRAELWKFLVHFATPVFALALLTIWMLERRAMFAAPYSVLLAAAAGFSISYYAQLKGWAYHSYPMLALIVAAAAIAFVQRWPLGMKEESPGERGKRLGAAALLGLLAAAAFLWMSFHVDTRALLDPIRANVKNPKILAISSDIAVGHPLTRALNGKWVGRVCSQWIAAGSLILQLQTNDAAEITRLKSFEARDRAMLVEDIARERPDIILVDRIRFDWLKWANADAALANELAKYRELAIIDDILILRRK